MSSVTRAGFPLSLRRGRRALQAYGDSWTVAVYFDKKRPNNRSHSSMQDSLGRQIHPSNVPLLHHHPSPLFPRPAQRDSRRQDDLSRT